MIFIFFYIFFFVLPKYEVDYLFLPVAPNYDDDQNYGLESCATKNHPGPYPLNFPIYTEPELIGHTVCLLN